jgi:hypothetical protein
MSTCLRTGHSHVHWFLFQHYAAFAADCEQFLAGPAVG